MWNVILHLLSIMGSILLVLLAILLAALLTVLFFPVTYRLRGRRSPDEAWFTARAGWLFGLVRLQFSWPEPGRLLVKLFWKTVFDSGRTKKEAPPEKKKQPASPEYQQEKSPEAEEQTKTETKASVKAKSPGTPPENNPENRGTEAESCISAKSAGIKYTIQGIYDKIKVILENISYYSGLLQEENTAKLWRHVKLRLGKIWKNVRPRHINAEILFGAGSPDTTGYLFGLYGMLSPLLGPGIRVTPDFTQTVFRGDADISGHITTAALLWNGLRLLLDRKLHLFIRKIKRNPDRKNQSGHKIK